MLQTHQSTYKHTHMHMYINIHINNLFAHMHASMHIRTHMHMHAKTYTHRYNNHATHDIIPHLYTGSCGGWFTASADSYGSIQTPNYPSVYSSNVFCRWTITAPSGYQVRLSFINFKTRADQDIVKVCDGDRCLQTNIAQLSGSPTVSDLNYVSSGASLSVELQTGSQTGEKGFSALYTAVIVKIGTPDISTTSSSNLTSPDVNNQTTPPTCRSGVNLGCSLSFPSFLLILLIGML